jgi:hypothetical protein
MEVLRGASRRAAGLLLHERPEHTHGLARAACTESVHGSHGMRDAAVVALAGLWCA